MTTSITSASVNVNVKDFGAIGDGVTLDRATIQSAIDALNAIYVATGRQQSLEFSDGVFLLDAVTYLRDDGITVFGAMSLLLRDGVHLQGRGTLKLMDSAYGPGAFFRIFASRDVTRLSNASISGITIDGNSAHQLASDQCNNIVLECLDNVVVENVTSLNANGASIMLRPTSELISSRYCSAQACRSPRRLPVLAGSVSGRIRARATSASSTDRSPQRR